MQTVDALVSVAPSCTVCHRPLLFGVLCHLTMTGEGEEHGEVTVVMVLRGKGGFKSLPCFPSLGLEEQKKNPFSGSQVKG